MSFSIGSLGSGAATGASIGSIVPGLGTGIGAGVGAIASLLGGIFGGKQKKKESEYEAALRERALQIADNQNRYAAGVDQAKLGRDFTGRSSRAQLLEHLLGGINLGGNVHALKGLQGVDLSTLISPDKWQALETNPTLPAYPDLPTAPKVPGQGWGVAGSILGTLGQGLLAPKQSTDEGYISDAVRKALSSH